MSKVVITGNASGTGDFTIAAPNSNTDRTLTLPDQAGEILVNGTTSNVGIGTSSPTTALSIVRNSGAGSFASIPYISLKNELTVADPYSFAGVYIEESVAGVQFRTEVTGTGTYGGPAALLRVQSAHPLAFRTADTERMRITSTGNVGIGTSSPSQAFDVVGSAQISFGGGNTYQYFQSTNNYVGRNTSGDFWMNVAGGQNLLFGISGAEKMRIDSIGRVTMPNQPMLSASRTTNFGSNSASQTLINYDTAQVNVGNHYNTTSGLFTCPVNGNYRVTAFGMNVGATNSGVFVYNAVSVRKNNSQIGATAYNYGDGYVHMSGNWIIPASAGDSISIFTASCLANYGQLTIELIS